LLYFSDDYYADLFAKGNVSMTAYIDYSIVFGDYDNFKTYDNMGIDIFFLSFS
jgi:hypothetical protein